VGVCGLLNAAAPGRRSKFSKGLILIESILAAGAKLDDSAPQAAKLSLLNEVLKEESLDAAMKDRVFKFEKLPASLIIEFFPLLI
jgi:hypothetical protein